MVFTSLAQLAILLPAVLAVAPLQLASGSSPIPGPSDTPARSLNWNGYVYQNYSANTFRTVSAAVVVPQPGLPEGGARDAFYDGQVWIGIDGAQSGANAAIAAVGFDVPLNLEADNPISISAWAQFYPGAKQYFSLSLNPTDTVLLTVATNNVTSAAFTIENLTIGTSATKTLTSTVALTRTNAQFVASRPDEANTPLVYYGPLTFTRVKATLADGSVVGPLLDAHAKYLTLVDSAGTILAGAGASTGAIYASPAFGASNTC